MGSILKPDTPVTIEYDTPQGRVSRTLPTAHEAKRLYVAKHKAGKNPSIAQQQGQHAKAIACYVRVSTVGQNLEGQMAVLQQWLEGNGIDPSSVLWFVDKRSGDNLDRPEFARLQAAIFAGQVDTVVCYKLDRLSRSLVDGINVLADWCNRKLRVVSVTQQLDFNGAVGQLLAAVLLGIAQMEQETRRERQAAGIAVAKTRGKFKGRKRGTTKAKPARAAKLRAKGLSVAEVANAMGVSRMTVFRYLRQCPITATSSPSKPTAAAPPNVTA